MSAISDRLFDLMLAVIRSGGYALVAALVAETLVLLLGPLRVRKRIGYALLLVVLVRMAIPAGLPASFSLFNFSPVQELVTDRFDLPTDGGPTGAYDIAIQGTPEYDDALYAGLTPTRDPDLSFSYIRYTTDESGSIRPAQTYRERYGALTAWIWFGGVLLFWGYGIVTTLLLRRRVATATRVEPGVYESDRITAPFILGIFRPVIYLPLGLTPQQRELILCHERMHLRWGDHIVKLLTYFLTGLHWMTVWLGVYFYRLLLYAMEEACDQDALRQLGEARRADYGETLLLFSTRRQLRQVMTVAFSESWIRDRIRQVLKYRSPRRILSLPAALLALAVALSLSTDALPSGDVEAPLVDLTLYQLLPEGFVLADRMELSGGGQTVTPDADTRQALRSRLYAPSFADITELGSTTVAAEDLPCIRLFSRDGGSVELTFSDTALVLYDPASGLCRRAAADRISLASVRVLLTQLLSLSKDAQGLYDLYGLPQKVGDSALGWTLCAADASKAAWLYANDTGTDFLLLWDAVSYRLPLQSGDTPFLLRLADLNGDDVEELTLLCTGGDGQRLYVCTPEPGFRWRVDGLFPADLAYYLELDFGEWADDPERLELATPDGHVRLELDRAALLRGGSLLPASNDPQTVGLYQNATFSMENDRLTLSATRMVLTEKDGETVVLPAARLSADITFTGAADDAPFRLTLFQVSALDIP